MESSRPLIVGAGPIGLACAISARRRGLDPLVVDAGPIAASIVRYPVGMTFFTTPERLEIGGHPLVCSGAKATREEALKYYRGVARAEGIRVRTYTRLIGATLLSQNSVDLILRDNSRVRARLQRTCPALDYYRGFYINATEDGRICADRDSIHSRAGGECQIDSFRALTAERP